MLTVSHSRSRFFDTAKPSNDELDQIWSGIRKHSQVGLEDELVIQKCERDWFYQGVSERTLQLRVAFMHAYMEDLIKKMPKANSVTLKPPVESEQTIIRAALLKHRQTGDTYMAIIQKCIDDWTAQYKQERDKVTLTA